MAKILLVQVAYPPCWGESPNLSPGSVGGSQRGKKTPHKFGQDKKETPKEREARLAKEQIEREDHKNRVKDKHLTKILAAVVRKKGPGREGKKRRRPEVEKDQCAYCKEQGTRGGVKDKRGHGQLPEERQAESAAPGPGAKPEPARREAALPRARLRPQPRQHGRPDHTGRDPEPGRRQHQEGNGDHQEGPKMEEAMSDCRRHFPSYLQTDLQARLKGLQAVQAQIWAPLAELYQPRHPQTSHPFQVGNSVYVRRHRTQRLEPRWKEPYIVLLTTPTAIKVDGISTWIHASHAKAAPTPPETWRLRRSEDPLKIRLSRYLNSRKINRPTFPP
nr:uncharacterized protein LOC123570361 [Macaca fascicularis]